MAKKRTGNRSSSATSGGGSMQRLRSGFRVLTGVKGKNGKREVTFLTVLSWGALLFVLGFFVWAIRG